MVARFTCILALVLLVTGCGSILNLSNSVYEFCPSNTDPTHQYFGSPDADDLVIFIHGLCGDAKTTWTNANTHFVFPEELARDFASENQPAYVISFNYVSRLQESPSILSIADQLEFEISELLKKHTFRTLRIVAHSMGGLVAREYILRRQTRAHPQLKVTNLVLLAAPNNGSELAELGRLVPEYRQVQELRHIDKGNTYLESLNKDWNREFKGGAHARHVLLYAGYEELPVPAVGKVVKLSSAISYADQTMGFQEDHVSIAKPKERTVLYRWVKAKLEESLTKTARQLLDGMVKQGLLAEADVLPRLPRTAELLEGLQALAGTELDMVFSLVKAGQFKEALALLAKSEPNENQLIEHIARRRFTQGEIYELQFQMEEAASYYSQAVQLVPTNATYRQRYGWLLIDMGNAQGAISQFDEVVRLSRTSGDLFLEGAAIGSLGVAYTNLGQYSKVLEYYEQALAIHRKGGHVRGEGEALDSLGNAYASLGQYPKAIEYHTQALAVYRMIGDVQGVASVLGNLGVVYAHIGQYLKAIDYFVQALAIDRKIGNVRNEGNTLGNLGSTYADQGQYPKAIEAYEQALVIRRKIGDVRGESADLGNLGTIYGDLGQYSKAIEYYEKALAIRRKIGDKGAEANVLGNLGVAYANLGQNSTAIEFHKQALEIRHKIGDVPGIGNDLGNLGVAYANLGQYPAAVEYYEKAIKIQHKISDVRSEGNNLENLAIAYANLGQYRKSIEFHEQALAIHREIGDVRREGIALGNLGRVYEHLGQYQKAIESYQQALAICRQTGDIVAEATNLTNLGRAYSAAGDIRKSLQHLKMAKPIYEKRLDIPFPLNSLLDSLETKQ